METVGGKSNVEVVGESGGGVTIMRQSTSPLGGTKVGFFPTDWQMCVLRCMGSVIGGFSLVGNKVLLKNLKQYM